MSQQTDTLKQLCQQVIDSVNDYETDIMTNTVTVSDAVQQLSIFLEKLRNESLKEPDKDRPTFQPEWYWAFTTLLLYKVGGIEVISQKMLDKFNIDDMPKVVYDHDKKAWVMKLRKGEMPTIVTVPKKILRKKPRVMLS